MNKPDTSHKRRTLRKAERVFGDPAAEAELAAESVSFGPTEEFSGPEFLALLEGQVEPATPSLTVTVYFDDTPVPDRGVIEDPLSETVETAGVGEWVGSGQGQIGPRAFFDVTFAVTELDVALPLVLRRLRELGAGATTTVACSDGSVHGLA